MDELQILGRWSSWGAVPNIFNKSDDAWASERVELGELLSEAEYQAAATTTINAHYTDPAIASVMWQLVQNLGVVDGDVLEPGCGSGTFMGLAPGAVRMTGVELDPTTAAIASYLYPQHTVRAESFADSAFPAGSFDAAIGNVPFGDIRLYDRVHNSHNHSIHNHFLIKSLDLVRPGGLVVALTSSFTMDAVNPAARRELFEQADLVAALRLPTGAHRRTADTDALTDIVVLRRRLPGEAPRDDGWLVTAPANIDGRDRRINSYFLDHPEHVLGQLHVGTGMYGADTLSVIGDIDGLPDLLEATLASVASTAQAAGLTATERADLAPAPVAAAPKLDGAVGTISGNARDGFSRIGPDGPEEITRLGRDASRELEQLLAMRDMGYRLLQMQAATRDETTDIVGLRRRLLGTYEAYRDRFGPINRVKLSASKRIDPDTSEPVMIRRSPRARLELRTDPRGPLVMGMENYDEALGTATPAALLKERVVIPRTPPLGVDTPEEAVAIASEVDGEVTVDRVAALLGVEEPLARQRLGELVYEDPDSGRLVPRAEYLSGDVRVKRSRAAAAVDDGRDEFAVNVAALTKVLPRELTPADIRARLGAVWVSPEDHAAFLRELLDTPGRYVKVMKFGDRWEVDAPKYGLAATEQWGISTTWSAGKIFESTCNQKPITVSHDNKVDPVQTEAANEKAALMQERFASWVWADPERAEQLAAEYNRLFNSIVLRDYSAEGQTLSLPGLSATMTPRPHQLSAVARMINEPAVGLFHEVGAGKTGEMIMGAMELRRLGLASKPVVVVPNHMLEQFSREWTQWYPRANVLAASSADLVAANRRLFMARVATGDWDGIVMTRTAFEKLPVSTKFTESYIASEKAARSAQLDAAIEQGAKSVKNAQAALVRLEEKLKKRLDFRRDDDGLLFEDTGIDYLIVDEAHDFKNLATVSAIDGASIDGSLRASDLHMKLELLRQRNGARVATLATATPIANSVSEAHVMLRYLRPDLLEAAGVSSFDAWAATFAQVVSNVEVSATGAYQVRRRFASFQNVPELLRMWWVAGDVKTAEDLNLPTPELAVQPGGQRGVETITIDPSDELLEHIKYLGENAGTFKGGMLEVSTLGRKAAIDMRMIDGHAPAGPQKVDVAAGEILKVWQQTANNQYVDLDGEPSATPGGFQLVFCDYSTPKADQWNIYQELKEQLVASGMPARSIRFIHDAKNDAEKGQLFAACRAGEVSVLVGSTPKMGVGTNVQARAVALHHLDAPWRPADIHQRDGRILRQGNQNQEVRIVRYVTGKSFDAFMWQTLERKAKFISQVLRGTLDVREIDDIGDATLSLGETKALAAGDPLLMEKAAVDNRLQKLVRLERAHSDEQSMFKWRATQLATLIENAATKEPLLDAAIAKVRPTKGDSFRATIGGRSFTKRADAAAAIAAALPTLSYSRPLTVQLGGHEMAVSKATYEDLRIRIRDVPDSEFMWPASRFAVGIGGVAVLENRVAAIPDLLAKLREQRATATERLGPTRALIGQPFKHADELEQLRADSERITALMKAKSDPTPPGSTEDADNAVADGNSGPVATSGDSVSDRVTPGGDGIGSQTPASSLNSHTARHVPTTQGLPPAAAFGGRLMTGHIGSATKRDRADGSPVLAVELRRTILHTRGSAAAVDAALAAGFAPFDSDSVYAEPPDLPDEKRAENIVTIINTLDEKGQQFRISKRPQTAGLVAIAQRDALLARHPAATPTRRDADSAQPATPSVSSDGPAIRHGRAGTVIIGTSKDDGELRAAIKAAGFRWSRNQGFWFLPRNWHFATRTSRVSELQSRLRSTRQPELTIIDMSSQKNGSSPGVPQEPEFGANESNGHGLTL